ncbi:hypothetical protein CDAR_95671 [Caerostris darwini]|uniref:Uncharacterized protein n=1 Tax=Caerostris darwini TaxID=1538125 RepID=A0AAV4UPU7_9ARAC|nr:hypothetical protein CDAR_95671 [Caerostris darwini]
MYSRLLIPDTDIGKNIPDSAQLVLHSLSFSSWSPIFCRFCPHSGEGCPRGKGKSENNQTKVTKVVESKVEWNNRPFLEPPVAKFWFNKPQVEDSHRRRRRKKTL